MKTEEEYEEEAKKWKERDERVDTMNDHLIEVQKENELRKKRDD